MAIDVKRSSRLTFTEALSIDGFEFLDLVDLPVYYPTVNDVEYVVQDGDTIDRLGYKFYQDPILFWVIAWANDIEVIPTQLTRGRTLIIPDPNYVKTNLLNGKTRRKGA